MTQIHKNEEKLFLRGSVKSMWKSSNILNMCTDTDAHLHEESKKGLDWQLPNSQHGCDMQPRDLSFKTPPI